VIFAVVEFVGDASFLYSFYCDRWIKTCSHHVYVIMCMHVWSGIS